MYNTAFIRQACAKPKDKYQTFFATNIYITSKINNVKLLGKIWFQACKWGEVLGFKTNPNRMFEQYQHSAAMQAL